VLYDRVPMRSEGMPKTVIFPDDARGSGQWSRQFPRLDRQRGSSRLPERSQPELQVGQDRNQPALLGLADAGRKADEVLTDMLPAQLFGLLWAYTGKAAEQEHRQGGGEVAGGGGDELVHI